jgi:hypothetical protein
MSATLSIEEGQPTTWPSVDPADSQAIPSTPEADEATLRKLARAAWLRVESYIGHRWGVRSVTFIVDGPGCWVPPLRPFAATTFEQWLDNGWTAVTLAPSALGGYVLDQAGPYRLTGNLGTATAPPQPVTEAVWRLTKFFEAADTMPAEERGLSRHKLDLGALSVEREQNPTWIARALQQSGAGDLLRPWRALGGR